MVKVREDLTGQTFGRWFVLRQDEDYIQPSNGKHHAMWQCQCSCKYHTIASVQDKHLKNGVSTKCKFCRIDEMREATIQRNKTRKHKPKSDEELQQQQQRKRIHRTWLNMLRRCGDQNCDHYEYYGGRGIVVCDEWKDFNTFYQWAITHGYQNDLSIDRIDVNGNYKPDNCRWVDNTTQANNKTNNRLITYDDTTHTLQEWERITGIDRRIISKRIDYYGWSIEEALTKPIKASKSQEEREIEFQGEKHSLRGWAIKLNIPRETLKSRLHNGWSIERTLTEEVHKKHTKQHNTTN